MSGTKWTKEQLSAIETRNCNLLVAAAAGSGKTAVLVERIIRIITNEDNTLYSLVNEKGTKLANINGIDSIKGVVIGEATIDDELILFTTTGLLTSLTSVIITSFSDIEYV